MQALFTDSLSYGFFLPIGGLDHLLAMLAVGLLSVQVGKHAWAYIPGVFVLFLIIGGVMGMIGQEIPTFEDGILISVILLGLLIAVQLRFVPFLAIPVVAVFGVIHGYPHGTEIPAVADPTQYVIGFSLASALMHLIGVGVGTICDAFPNPRNVRAILGGVLIGAGMVLLLTIKGFY